MIYFIITVSLYHLSKCAVHKQYMCKVSPYGSAVPLHVVVVFHCLPTLFLFSEKSLKCVPFFFF